MTFGDPQILAWLLVWLALGVAMWSYRRWQQRQLRRWAQPRMLEQALKQRRPWRLATGDLSLWLGVGLLVLALARPQWGQTKRQLTRQGLEIITMLDVSKSMQKKDLQPTRWKRAILELHGFCQRLRGDRLSLYAFSGESGLLAPLTDDYTALRQLAWTSRPGLFTEKGPGLTASLQDAQARLARRKGQSLGRAILIFTDGLSADDLQRAPKRLRQLRRVGVFVFFIHLQPASAPGMAALKQVASQAGAYLLDVRSLGFGLQAIHDSLSRLKRSARGKRSNQKPVERFPFFLAAGLALVVASRLLLPL